MITQPVSCDGKGPREDSRADSFSVIVPVYNEAKVLERFLTKLSNGLPSDADVIISLNGCSDESASIASKFSDRRFQTILSEKPGKALAIRNAETLTDKFPRFYVDADIDVSGSDLCHLAKQLAVSQAMMISPKIEFRYQGATRAAKAFNDMWICLPYVQSGCFQYVIGVCETGRGHWGLMPDVLADDTYMKLCIPPDARTVDPDVTIVARLPTTFYSILRVRKRIALGLQQLRAMGYNPAGTSPEFLTKAVVRQPIEATLIYFSGVVLGRLWARCSPLRGFRWIKDETSRS